jgi:transcriptional regulator with XRE-family HTH domain
VAPPRRPPEPLAHRPFSTSTALRALGEICLLRRRELDLGVEQLAGRMGVDARQVRRIERGEANLTFETLVALATGLERLPSDVLVHVERSLMLTDGGEGAATRCTRAVSDAPSIGGHGSPIKEPVHRSLGLAVAAFRRHARLTQRELAGAAGLSLSAIQSVESGRHAPTTLTLDTLAQALKCDVTDFFSARGARRAAKARAATSRQG